MKNTDLKSFYDKVYKKGEKKHYTKLLFKDASLPLDEKEVLHSANWKGKTVLDVGCGTGLMASLIGKAGAKKVLGLDFSPEAILKAKEAYSLPNLEFQAENFEKHKDTYYIIVSLGTLEHMDNPFEALQRMKKLLKPKGKIILTCPNWTNPRGYILQTLRLLWNAPITLADIHYLTPVEFQKWSKKLQMKLEWRTFDHDWGSGKKLIKDFERRLPNVLRDIGITGKEKEIKEFIKWTEEHVLPFPDKTPEGGAVGLYILSK